MINNISFVMYTNEKYLPIAKLSIDRIAEYFTLQIPKYLATNHFDSDLDYHDFSIVDTQTPFQTDASHFREVMYILLTRYVRTKYFLYFSEDYYLINYFKSNNFIKLLSYIEDHNIGYMSLIAHPPCFGSPVEDVEQYGLKNIMKFNSSYTYTFSMQPAVWNRDFFLEIIESNPVLTLQMLDTTNFNNRDKIHLSNGWNYSWDPYGFIFNNSLFGNYAFDTHNGIDDYYMLLYSEIVRGGKFNLNNHFNNRNTVQNIIAKYNLENNPIYKEFLLT